jgi:hypothetical protein
MARQKNRIDRITIVQLFVRPPKIGLKESYERMIDYLKTMTVYKSE